MVTRGALLNWIDVAHADRRQFLEWYQDEHLAERTSTPGFVRGRRFQAEREHAPGEFLTVYDTVDVAVLSSRAYLDRLDSPTELTKRTVPTLRDFRRAAATVTARAGVGTSGVIATFELEAASAAESDVAAWLQSEGIPSAVAGRDILSATLYEPDAAATTAKATTAEGRGGTEALGPAVLVAELSPLARTEWPEEMMRSLADRGAKPAGEGLPVRYRLLVDLLHEALTEEARS